MTLLNSFIIISNAGRLIEAQYSSFGVIGKGLELEYAFQGRKIEWGGGKILWFSSTRI